MSVELVLFNGKLTAVQIGLQTTIVMPVNECHIVNLGSSLMVNLQFEGIGSYTFGLVFGGTVIIELNTFHCDYATVSFEKLHPALNFTEKAFSAEVRSLLKGNSSEHKENTASVEGATSISKVAEKCFTRKPAHAHTMISSMNDVNSFDGAHGEKLCVAKKSSKPRSLQMCPKVEMTIGIESISRRASSGEAMWRQCAASFSTMMRHFQKAPSSFKWEADAERRTIITKAAICN